jgi:hypothetical protein
MSGTPGRQIDMESGTDADSFARRRLGATPIGLADVRLGFIVVIPDAISIHNNCKESLQSVN